jgi:SPP1 gp7 family putative phage head morphogenesis protein
MYGENNVIRYRKLLENLSDTDKSLLMERMNDFAVKYPQYAYLMPVRESIYKLNRLEGLQTNIRMQQLEIGAVDNAELEKHLQKLALRSANLTAEELGFGKNFYVNDNNLIAKTINAQWTDGKNFSQRIWNNRNKLADYLNNDFAKAIARGDSYEKCIRALGQRFGKVSRNDMYRLIYTEGTFVQNEASITPFEKDFEEYAISIADSRACSMCKALNGERFKIKDRKAGVNFPPFHSWCRCSFTVEVDDEWNSWIDSYVQKNSNNTLANSDGSGIINFRDSDSLYKPITQESIDSIPLMDIFQNEELNALHQQASKKLLEEIRKAKVSDGVEFSIVYDENMQPIEEYDEEGNKIYTYTYRRGKEGSTKIDNPGVFYHAFHNHGSGETFSFSDLVNFAENDEMISLTAQGNNGNKYVIIADKNSDKWGYLALLLIMGEEVIYSVEEQEFTLNYLYGQQTRNEAQKKVDALEKQRRDELEKAVIEQTENCLSRSENYEIRYYKTKVVD